MSRFYVLAKDAVADLEGIVLYTEEQWGSEQREIYISQLEKAAEDVA